MRSKMMFLVMTALGMVPTAALATLRVGNCPGAQHVTIQTAIDAAHDGNTIVVCPGPYDEQINVYRRVRLHGLFGAMVRPTNMVANSTSLRTGRAVAAIAIVSARATIDNLDFDGSGSGLTGCDPEGPHMIGVFVRNTQAKLKHNRVHGIHLGDGDLDWPKLLETLRRRGHAGPVLFEIAPHEDVWTNLEQGLARLFGAAAGD